MENASKALIIAGAILISIVLVSVGVLVVNSLRPDEAIGSITQQEVDSFNSKFLSSTGNSVAGSTVKTLISTVITNNAQNADYQISINDMTASADLSAYRNTINNSRRYKVLITEYATDGRIAAITVE